MKTRPEDISPEMREFYKGLKGRPGMYIGSNDIHDLNVFMQGMNICVNKFFDENEKPVLIPEGFTEYVEDYYGEHMTFNSFSFVEHLESEPDKGIAKWFELLDSYLISLGYEPLPEILTEKETKVKKMQKRSGIRCYKGDKWSESQKDHGSFNEPCNAVFSVRMPDRG